MTQPATAGRRVVSRSPRRADGVIGGFRPPRGPPGRAGSRHALNLPTPPSASQMFSSSVPIHGSRGHRGGGAMSTSQCESDVHDRKPCRIREIDLTQLDDVADHSRDFPPGQMLAQLMRDALEGRLSTDIDQALAKDDRLEHGGNSDGLRMHAIAVGPIRIAGVGGKDYRHAITSAPNRAQAREPASPLPQTCPPGPRATYPSPSIRRPAARSAAPMGPTWRMSPACLPFDLYQRTANR